MSIGSCLLANELEGMGKKMLEMRINGDSWADIAKEFDLPNPSAARSKFTKLTGITDYKVKGQTLVHMANDLSAKASKTGIFEAKVAQKKVKKALDVDAELNDLTGFQKISMKQFEKDYGKDHPVYKAKLQQYKSDNAIKGVAPKPVVDKAVFDNMTEVKPKAKWKSDQQLADDTGLSPAKVGEIIEMNQNGQGYLAIKNKLGVEFKQIDEVVWNSLLKKYDGDIWKAYQAKVTSQTGFDAVQKMVWDLKKSGLSVDDIAKLDHTPPKEIVQGIIDGKWKLPPAGTTTVYIPPPPPAPPAVFGVKVETGYQYKSNQSMLDWIRDDTDKLPGGHRKAISNYTGSGSSPINEYLRKGNIPGYGSMTEESLSRTVKYLDAAMRPVPFNMKVTRYTDSAAFGTNDLSKLVGDVFRDKGYLSTSVKESGVFTHHNTRMVIDVPAGAKARYVQDISIHKSEQELLLARNTPIKINSVEREAGGRWVVYGEVVV